jgi:hypothetical protein
LEETEGTGPAPNGAPFFHPVILAQPIPVFQKRETLAAIQTGRDPRLQNSDRSRKEREKTELKKGMRTLQRFILYQKQPGV